MAKATNGRFAKVIFFIADFQPTDADMSAAGEIGPGVVFRNAMYVPENPSPGSIEVCDFVAGDNIPKPYADRFPKWDGSDEGEAPAKLFDHDKAGNEGPEVVVALPGTVPTSETGSPVDPATNLSIDPVTGEPLVRAQTASDEGRDLVDPANAAPAVVGNGLTGRADATAHERTGPDGTDAANASAAAAGASPAPTTPATQAATPTPAAKPDTAPAPAKPAAAPKATAKATPAPAAKPGTSWKPNA